MKSDNRLGDLKAMYADALEDELLRLKKDSSTCASSERRVSSRTRRACAWSGAISRG